MSALEGVNAGKFACEEGLILLGRAQRDLAVRCARDLDTTPIPGRPPSRGQADNSCMVQLGARARLTGLPAVVRGRSAPLHLAMRASLRGHLSARTRAPLVRSQGLAGC